MKPGAAVLAALRAKPAMAIAAWGFIVRGQMLRNPVGGGCTLTCEPHGESSIYSITVNMGAGDWYVPFAQNQAPSCDVPRGQPDGTLVVTYPMNGCALEVREVNGTNRFYHDSDGKSMPDLLPGIVQKFRVTTVEYEGVERIPANTYERIFARMFADEEPAVAPLGFEHSIICVKRGNQWEVYNSSNMIKGNDGWQIKDRVPYHLGSFDD